MGLGTAEVLRILYKHYGGINFFEGKPTILLLNCLENAVKKEQELPNILLKCLNILTGETYSLSNKNERNNRKLRSKEDILKDYGMM